MIEIRFKIIKTKVLLLETVKNRRPVMRKANFLY